MWDKRGELSITAFTVSVMVMSPGIELVTLLSSPRVQEDWGMLSLETETVPAPGPEYSSSYRGRMLLGPELSSVPTKSKVHATNCFDYSREVRAFVPANLPKGRSE